MNGWGPIWRILSNPGRWSANPMCWVHLYWSNHYNKPNESTSALTLIQAFKLDLQSILTSLELRNTKSTCCVCQSCVSQCSEAVSKIQIQQARQPWQWHWFKHLKAILNPLGINWRFKCNSKLWDLGLYGVRALELGLRFVNYSFICRGATKGIFSINSNSGEAWGKLGIKKVECCLHVLFLVSAVVVFIFHWQLSFQFAHKKKFWYRGTKQRWRGEIKVENIFLQKYLFVTKHFPHPPLTKLKFLWNYAN